MLIRGVTWLSTSLYQLAFRKIHFTCLPNYLHKKNLYAINVFNAELMRLLLMKPTISFDVKNHTQEILCNTRNFIMEFGQPVKWNRAVVKSQEK